MSKYEAVKRVVSMKGRTSIGWYRSVGYVQQNYSVKCEKWCVIEAGKPATVAICRSEKMAKTIANALNGDCNE